MIVNDDKFFFCDVMMYMRIFLIVFIRKIMICNVSMIILILLNIGYCVKLFDFEEFVEFLNEVEFVVFEFKIMVLFDL